MKRLTYEQLALEWAKFARGEITVAQWIKIRDKATQTDLAELLNYLSGYFYRTLTKNDNMLRD